MVGESYAIIVMIGVMAFMYLRAGKPRTALLTLPLVCSPLAYLAGVYLWYLPKTGEGLSQQDMRRIGVLVLGALVSVGLCVVLSRRMESAKGRGVYIVCSGFFSAALAVAYVLYLL